MASKRHIRRRGCEKKRQYGRSEAIRVAQRLRTIMHEEAYRAYLCRSCHDWHVGRRNARQRQGAQAKAKHAAQTR